MAMESLYGLICLSTKANSMKIKYKVKVEWSGLMENNTMVSGKIIKCMERVHSSGLMVEFMLVSIMKIKNMGLEELNGQTEKFTKDIGEKAFKMDKVK